MPCEIIVKVKNHSKSLTKKFLVYDKIEASPSDPNIDQYIEETEKDFGVEATKTSVTIKLIMDD